MTEMKTETKTETKEPQKTLDEFGLDRKVFDPGSDSEFLKMKDKEKIEIGIPRGGIRQDRKKFKKFENGQPVKDENGNDVIEREGDILVIDIDRLNGQPASKTWEVTSKKLANLIFSFLDKREKDGTPYLFSRLFEVTRIGTGKETQYNMFPTEKKE